MTDATPGPLPAEQVLVRPVRIEDAEAISALRLQPRVLAGTLSLPSERIGDRRQRIDGFGDDDHVFVAEVESTAFGVAGLHVGRGRQRHGAGIGLMVDDRFQGRGIGRLLLETLLDLADNHLGLLRVELEVMPDNDRAIQLYERLGFVIEGRKRRAVLRHGEYIDLLVMGRVR